MAKNDGTKKGTEQEDATGAGSPGDGRTAGDEIVEPQNALPEVTMEALPAELPPKPKKPVLPVADELELLSHGGVQNGSALSAMALLGEIAAASNTAPARSAAKRDTRTILIITDTLSTR